MLKTTENNKSLIKTYSMSAIEIELLIKNRSTEMHSYHPELEKKIKELGDIMKHEEENECPTIETYLDGIFERKLIEFGEQQVKKEIELFESELKDFFTKEEKQVLSVPHGKRFKIRKEEFADVIIEGCKSIKRGDRLGKNIFSSPMLYDSYLFAASNKTPLEFLTYIHRTHAIKGEAPEDLKLYTRMKYIGGTFKLEMYENSPMFAELYQYIRAGMYENALKFVEENKNFFWLICNNFYSSIMHWMQSLGFIHEERKYSMEWEEVPTNSDDPFKLLFYRLFTGSTECVKSIITTIEDFLWYQIITTKTITACNLKKKKNSNQEIFKLLQGVITPPRLLQASIILKQWTAAMQILQDEAFRAGEILFLSYAISQKIREENPSSYPIKRERAVSAPAECTDLFVKGIQRITSLFMNPCDKLCIVNMASPFISSEWLEDLVSEVFIASEDYDVLGRVDSMGRKEPPTIQEYVNVSAQAVIQRVAQYYIHSGELEKALKISYIESGKKTLEILTTILVDKIRTKEYAKEDLEKIVRHFNNELVSFLWDVLCIGASKDNAIQLIRRTGLIPANSTADVLKKVKEIDALSLEVKSVIPTALVIMSKRLGEHPYGENRDLAKALLLLAGALKMDTEIIHEIVSGISSLL